MSAATLLIDAGRPLRLLRRRALLVAIASLLLVAALPVGLGVLWGLWWLSVALLTIQAASVALQVSSTLRAGRRATTADGVHPILARTQPRLARLIEATAASMGMPAPAAYIVKSDEVNAVAVATGWGRGAMLLTTGWLSQVDELATIGVLGHELAHIRNRDMLWMATLSGLHRPVTGASAAAARQRAPSGPGAAIGAILYLIALPLHLALRWVSRSRESLADLTAADALGAAPVLATLRMLRGMERSRGLGHSGDPVMARLVRTHPATRSRLDLLSDVSARQVAVVTLRDAHGGPGG